MATMILNQQIDAMPGELMNPEQKEYVKTFIETPPKVKEIIIETMLEH